MNTLSWSIVVVAITIFKKILSRISRYKYFFDLRRVFDSKMRERWRQGVYPFMITDLYFGGHGGEEPHFFGGTIYTMRCRKKLTL